MSAPSLSTDHQSTHDDPEMPNVGSRINHSPRLRASPPLRKSFLGSRDGQAFAKTLSTVVESAMQILAPAAYITPPKKIRGELEMTTKSDSEAMERAKTAMRAAKMPFRQTDPYQIKFGRLNFYPNRGTIFRDGDRSKLEDRGIIAFMKLCGYPK